MITAIDSSVLWAIVKDESTSQGWLDLLARQASEGSLVICPIVFAELAPSSADSTALANFLEGLDIQLDPISAEAAFLAGTVFRKYRRAGGPREHLVPDFVIAAHARVQASRLATIDRGYIRRWFEGLPVVAP